MAPCSSESHEDSTLGAPSLGVPGFWVAVDPAGCPQRTMGAPANKIAMPRRTALDFTAELLKSFVNLCLLVFEFLFLMSASTCPVCRCQPLLSQLDMPYVCVAMPLGG